MAAPHTSSTLVLYPEVVAVATIMEAQADLILIALMVVDILAMEAVQVDMLLMLVVVVLVVILAMADQAPTLAAAVAAAAVITTLQQMEVALEAA
jgi:hypothetical protein